MSENLETLERLISKGIAGDYEGAAQELHDDLVVDEPPGLPYGGEWRGRDSSGKLKAIITSLWDQEMGPMRHWDAGDVVFAHRDITWTAKETGKSLSSSVLEMFEFRDGKIARISVYIKDTRGLIDTLVP